MSSDAIISVEGLGKRYRLGSSHSNERYTALRDVVAEKAKSLFRRTNNSITDNGSPAETRDFWALKDVSFEVKQGEVLGIIGRNGAGKSTLLKILSRITEPTEGRIKIKGRVASLLEVGTGFHPELTGRENIFLNGAILGMHRHEIKAKFDEIVAFAEVEKFLDTPVKRYSSGMYVRLAFAVAAHLEPEILVIDEVLAVGDAEFQKKCLGKMSEVAACGRTVLFVSHNMAAVENLCTSATLLQTGRIAFKGPVSQAAEQYGRSVMNASRVAISEQRNRQGSGIARCVQLLSRCGECENLRAQSGEAVEFEMLIQASTDIVRVLPGLNIHATTGRRIATLWGGFTSNSIELKTGLNRVLLLVERLDLVPGFYQLGVSIGRENEAIDIVDDACLLEITAPKRWVPSRYPNPTDHGVVFPAFTWRLDQQ